MRVLVTRPEPGASETAARLEALGHEAVVLPLTEIRALQVGGMPDSDRFDAVAVTSANAVRHAPRAVMEKLAGKPCYAVGRQTAEAALSHGFRDVRSADGAAAALAGMMAAEMPGGARVAYLCGRVRRSEFETLLAGQGIEAVPLETYDTIRKDWSAGAAASAMGHKPAEAILVHSAAAAEALTGLLDEEEMAALLQHAGYFCLSPRVADSLGCVSPSAVRVSAEPSEAALISLLAAGRG